MGLDYFDNLATDFPLSKGNGTDDPALDEFVSPQPEEPPSE